MLAESLQHSLSEMAGDDFVKGMRMKGFELRRFSAGEIAPELLEARAYDLGPTALAPTVTLTLTLTPNPNQARAYDLGPTAMAFDFDVRWHSQMVAEVDAITAGVGARVPVSVRNLRFDGPVRLIVTDLTAAAPGYGAVLLSLPTRPEVAIDCSVAYGEVTRVPWLRSELERSMQQQITDTMLWPRRVVCPATRDGMVNDTVLSPQKLDELSRDDPLLRAFAARDTYSWNNAPTFKKARGKARTGQGESSGDTPGFNINLGVLDFQGVASAVNEFNWTQQLQARYTSLPRCTLTRLPCCTP